MTALFSDVVGVLSALGQGSSAVMSDTMAGIVKDRCRAVRQRLDIQTSSTGPLAGLPIAVKDNICLEGVPAECGSRILEGHKAQYTSTALARLMRTGVRVVARTNMDEFAMGSSTENSAFGPTLNPWDLSRVPGGSSGGSAALVGDGVVAVALGSDTGGSVRQPAAFCGVVGYKPSYGILSRRGLVAFASSLDQIGLFTRTVSCIPPLMKAMGGIDPLDSTSVPGPKDWSLKDISASTLKVGVLPRKFLEGVQTEILAAYQEALDWFTSKGAKVMEVPMADFDKGLSVYYIVAVAEASSNLSRFDGVRYGLRKSPGALDALYEESRAAGFGPEVKRRILLGTHVLSAGFHDAYYTTARRVQKIIQNQHETSFGLCDVLITPTTASTAFKLGAKTLDPVAMYLSDQFTVNANLAGLPALSVPCGLDKAGLPMGLHFVGRQNDDVRLLSITRAWEAAHPFTARPCHG